MILGELEPTMLQCFIKAGKLKRWLARPDCSDAIKQCKNFFDRAYHPKSDDNTKRFNEDELFFDDDPSTETQASADSSLKQTPDDLYPLLRQDQVALPARHKHKGVIYARSSTHLGNSLVQFYPQGDRTTSPVPASIKYIFYDRHRTAYAVQRQVPLPDNHPDPFARYPHFPAKLYSSAISQNLEVIEVNWVLSHFARWQLSPQYAVVLSLSLI
jgi:hypothetical protein